jgi:hypothetical protein
MGPEVKELYRFLRQPRIPGTAGVGTPPRSPLAAAYELHIQGGANRDEIAARLLNGQAFSEIAATTGIPETVVRIYDHFFFDVSGNLEARDWLLMEAFRVKDPRDPAEAELWRIAGLFFPRFILDLLIRADRGRGVSDDDAESARLIRLLAHEQIAFLHGLPTNPQIYREARRLIRQEGGADLRASLRRVSILEKLNRLATKRPHRRREANKPFIGVTDKPVVELSALEVTESPKQSDSSDLLEMPEGQCMSPISAPRPFNAELPHAAAPNGQSDAPTCRAEQPPLAAPRKPKKKKNKICDSAWQKRTDGDAAPLLLSPGWAENSA